MVILESTDEPVTGMKSARTFIGSRLYLMVELTAASRSLNLIVGACWSFANVSSRWNSSILAGHGRVDELDVDVVADPVDVTVAPLLERVGRSGSAAFLNRTLVGAAGRVRLGLVGRAVLDVDHAAVGLPSGNSGSEPLVGIGDAAVMLFAILVLFGIGSGVAAEPELLNELLSLLVGLESREGLTLLVGDDVADLFVEPLLVRSLQLLAQPGFLLPFLLLGHRLGNGFPLLAGILGFVLLGLSQRRSLRGKSRDQTNHP